MTQSRHDWQAAAEELLAPLKLLMEQSQLDYTLFWRQLSHLSDAALAFCPVVGVLFSALQLYWAALLIRQVRKLLAAGGGDPKPQKKGQ